MQKHKSLFCSGWWPFIVLPLLLTTITLLFEWRDIERKLVTNAQQVLDQAYPWSKAESYNRGRDLLLTGSAPTQQAVEQAIQTVQLVEGLRTVQFVGHVTPALQPAQITIAIEGNDIVLSGMVNNHITKKSITENAKAQFGTRVVADQLTVANDIASAPDLSGLLAIARLLTDGTTLTIDGKNLTLQGKVKSVDQKNSLASRFASIFPGPVTNKLIVEVDKRQQCRTKLDNLMAQRKINFDSGTIEIKAESSDLINSIFDTIRECPASQFVVEGHTDSTGADSANLQISKDRAQAVIDRLVTLGLDASRFSASGFGASRPIQSNDTANGRAANRRIEFKLKM